MKIFTVLLVAVLHFPCVSAYAQSLGDFAKEEQTRRNSIPATKTITIRLEPLAEASGKEISTANPADEENTDFSPGEIQLRSAPTSDPKKNLDYAFYIPANWNEYTQHPVIVLVPGLNGRGENMINRAWIDLAEEWMAALVAPSFVFEGEEAFSQEKSYQYPAAWSGSALQSVIKQLRDTGLEITKLYMVGFSAGAQFVGRYSLLYPQDIQKCAIVGSGGNSTILSSNDVEYFYAIGGKEQQLRKDSARIFHEEAEKNAIKITLKEYPGVGHDFTPQIQSDIIKFFKQ